LPPLNFTWKKLQLFPIHVQSTCALPLSDAENAYMDNMQNASLMKCSLKLSNIDVLKHEESNISVRGSTKHNDETEGT
jgi:pseudo-response regulator 5